MVAKKKSSKKRVSKVSHKKKSIPKSKIHKKSLSKSSSKFHTLLKKNSSDKNKNLPYSRHDTKTSSDQIKKESDDKTASKAQKKKIQNYAKTTIQNKFDKKVEFKKRRMSKIFSEFLEKAGLHTTPKDVLTKIFYIDLSIISITTFIVILLGIVLGSTPSVVVYLIIQLWTILFVALYLLSLLGVFFYLDIRITNRTRQIEDVLPDFLQLAAANISAGMPIDRALWFAVRPRFGVLAKEIEEIAKSTIAGDDLSDSLLLFTKKYDSKILRESVNLIVAGIRSGGEIGELLNKISENILDTKLMKKEVSASVTTYVIFIGVASVLAAPGLFALSGQLLVVIQSIAANLAASSTGSAGASGLSISFGSESITLKDFKIFSVVLLSITSYFAAQIISVIRKGDGRDGLKNFPLFTLVSLSLFFFISYVLGILLGGLF